MKAQETRAVQAKLIAHSSNNSVVDVFFSYLQILPIQKRKYLLEFQGAGDCPEQHHAQCNRCKTIHYRIPGISPSRNQFGGKVFVDVSPTEK